ncbi:MAG TPA: ABC transporter substrate-binding protein [Xanthobacteraceae bacterium]|jgi:peptide/nickel transport system substrate-binding protein
MKFWRIAAAVALFALTCGTAAAQSTLKIGLAEDPDILDPTLARTYVGRIVFSSICDKLFDIDEHLNVVPQLALSHETSPDGKTVTIKLRPNVKFQDGEVFDAAAAKYSLERHLTMKGSFRKPEISAIDHVDVVDPLTIRIVLKQPYSPLIAQLTDRSGMMVAPKAAEAAGDKFGLHPVCAGPYKFVERVQQDRIVVEKFQDYWNKDNVHIDRIIYLPIVDATVRLANLKSGGLDMAERMLATDVKDIRSNPKLKLEGAIELGYQGLTINMGDNPRAKATPLGRSDKVRQALSLAIDRDALNQVVFNGEFMPGNQWVNPQHPYYQKSFPVPKRDLAKAKALMKEAGVTAPFSVDFMVPKGDETEAVAQVVQAMAKDIGIDMKIRVTEFATSLKAAEAGEFQAYLLAWSGRTDPDGNVYVFNVCKGPQNYSQMCNADADKALTEARTVSDVAKRKAIYESLAKVMLEQDPIIYLYHRRILIGLNARVQGYRQMPDGLIRVVGLTLK